MEAFWSWLLGIDRVRFEGGQLSLEWRHMPDAWVMFLVILPSMAFIAGIFYRRERRDVGTGPKTIMAALRGALFLLVALLLMEPVLTVETYKVRKACLAVLVDDSRSMRKADALQTREEKLVVGRATGLIPDGGDVSPAVDEALRGLTRADIVGKVLSNPRLRFLPGLDEKLRVVPFTFSSTAVAHESYAKLLERYRPEQCLGTETALGDAVRTAVNSLRGEIVAGVVIFSDGKSNAGMATREAATQLRQRYIPVYAVTPGVPRAPRNIGLSELEAREAVLANDEMKIDFKVSSFGTENDAAEVELWVHALQETDRNPSLSPEELERRIARSTKAVVRPVVLKGGGRKQLETIVYAPPTPGDFLLILRVPPRVDENTAHDNYLTLRLRVADDKIRVLYVEHPPRYEFRFLKNALIRDPKILAHTLLTSADEGFPQEHTRSGEPLFRQPLQEFPRDINALLEFDVVIYGDVDPSRLGPEAMKNLETFVTEFGGGLIFISGTEQNPRALAGTPLANLLPIVPETVRGTVRGENVAARNCTYRLDPDGKTSPITNFKEFQGDRDRNLEHWEDRDGQGNGLVGVRWFQRVRKLKAGATALVEAVVPGEEIRTPLFVTQHVGRGRVFWSGTDETWLWRYLSGDYPWFYPFWQQAMYWVREGKLLGARRYRATVDKERYTRGEPVQVYVNAYDQKFEPRQDASIEVFVDPPAGDRARLRLFKDAARDGCYEGNYLPTDTGIYTIWAGDEDEASRAAAKFTVFIPDREEDDPIIDVAALKDLAEGSYGGKVFSLDQLEEVDRAIQKSEMRLTETKEDDLWDSPLVYLIFAVLIAAEWILRKFYRMA